MGLDSIGTHFESIRKMWSKEVSVTLKKRIEVRQKIRDLVRERLEQL